MIQQLYLQQFQGFSMKKTALRKTIAFILFTGIFLFAQNIQAFYFASISPPVEYIRLTPGETYTHTVTITNKAAVTQVFNVSAVDFTSDGISGIPLLSENFTFPYITNERVALTEISLGPQEAKKIVFDIDVPINAVPNEYTFSILFSQKISDIETSKTQSQVAGTIASNVVVSITAAKDVETHPTMESITTRKFIDGFQPIHIEKLVAKNTYPYATQLEGSVVITSMLGNQVASFTIHPDMILGDGTRQVRFVSDEPTAPTTNVTHTSKFLFGVYRISYVSSITATITPLTSVIALPLIPLVLLLFILICYTYIRQKNIDFLHHFFSRNE